VRHEDPFPLHRLNGRCRFSEETFPGTHGNGQDAPITVIPWTPIVQLKSNLSSHSLHYGDTGCSRTHGSRFVAPGRS
jgi:hypothetical protein